MLLFVVLPVALCRADSNDTAAGLLRIAQQQCGRTTMLILTGDRHFFFVTLFVHFFYVFFVVLPRSFAFVRVRSRLHRSKRMERAFCWGGTNQYVLCVEKQRRRRRRRRREMKDPLGSSRNCGLNGPCDDDINHDAPDTNMPFCFE